MVKRRSSKRAKASAEETKTVAGPKKGETLTGGLGRDKEIGLWRKGAERVAGVDEAGRGPLAGPVVAAACVVPEDVHFEGVGDSKKVDEETRNRLFAEITCHPRVEYSIIRVEHDEIDEINILQATFRAMERAVAALPAAPNHVLIDGPYVPAGIQGDDRFGSEAIVKGDSKVFSIACASILAKVSRDKIMKDYHEMYPQYGFAQHKGYPTFAHRNAVASLGPCPIHRRSFGPVRNALEAFQEKPKVENDGAKSNEKSKRKTAAKKKGPSKTLAKSGRKTTTPKKRQRTGSKSVAANKAPRASPSHRAARRSPRLAPK